MKRAWLTTRRWPLTVRVPLLVAALMVVVGALASQLVLVQLERTQEAHLRTLTEAYVDGIAAAITPHLARRDPAGAFEVLDRSRRHDNGLGVVHAVAILPGGEILAATDPRSFPTDSRLPGDHWASLAFGSGIEVDGEVGLARFGRRLHAGGGEIGGLLARVDIRALLAERREVLLTLILLNGVGTLFLAAIGYVAVRRMLAPVNVLTRHVASVRNGLPVPIPEGQLRPPRTEFGRLFQRFNAMAGALAEREALATRLAEEEKLAQLGRLAAGMAHEVNNPLGGMQNTIATLRKHGADPNVRETSLSLIERGLIGIRNVVRAALVTYKGSDAPGWLTGAEIDDLQYLIQHEVARRRLEIVWTNRLPARVPADSGLVRQIVLNLLLNACAASPVGGRVELEASLRPGRMQVVVTDEGPGLPEPFAALLSRTDQDDLPEGTKGLGIWTCARLIRRLDGSASADWRPEGGTRIAVSMPLREPAQIDDAA